MENDTKTSRIQDARRVASDLLDCLETSSNNVDSIILKAQRLARLMRDTDAQTWLDYEMRGYPDNFNFSELGTCEKYAESGGRYNKAGKNYYSASLPRLEAILDAEQAFITSMKQVQPSVIVDNFLAKNATEELMKTQVNLQDQQKKKFSNSKQLYVSVKSSIHSFATEMYIALELGDAAQDIFESTRGDVDKFVRAYCPKAAEKLVAINERMVDSSSESLSAALTSCRRLLMTVADALFPARDEMWKDKSGKERKVGEDQYKNRILAYVSEKISSNSDSAIIEAELDLIVAKVNAVYEKTCKGVHANVGESEARLTVISTYILLGEIARLAK